MRQFNDLTIGFQKTLVLASCFLILYSCSPEGTKTNVDVKRQSVAPVKPRVPAPDFNVDSAFSFVKAQANMGPRIPGSKAHEVAANYFEKKLKQYGAEVTIQKFNAVTFDKKNWPSKNIIAAFNPEAANRILLSAHWDSRPFCDRDTNKANAKKACPGINDGASGVGVLLEIARLVSKSKPKLGIDIILFDMEDYGAGETILPDENLQDDWALGSQYWSKNPHKPGYVAKFGILLDMVGGKATNFPMEGYSTYFGGQIQSKIWAAGQNIGYANYFSNRSVGEVTDDHLYINKGANIPCVDIIGYAEDGRSFFPQHHTLGDNLDVIDKNTLKAVGQTVLEVIYNED